MIFCITLLNLDGIFLITLLIWDGIYRIKLLTIDANLPTAIGVSHSNTLWEWHFPFFYIFFISNLYQIPVNLHVILYFINKELIFKFAHATQELTHKFVQKHINWHTNLC